MNHLELTLFHLPETSFEHRWHVKLLKKLTVKTSQTGKLDEVVDIMMVTFEHLKSKTDVMSFRKMTEIFWVHNLALSPTLVSDQLRLEFNPPK